VRRRAGGEAEARAGRGLREEAIALLDTGLYDAVATARRLADRRARVGVDEIRVVAALTSVDCAVPTGGEVLRGIAASAACDGKERAEQGAG
jgi:hypothetical protein